MNYYNNDSRELRIFTGSISGRIAGVKITLTNTSNGVKQVTRTNIKGTASLIIKSNNYYSLRGEIDHFKTINLDDIMANATSYNRSYYLSLNFIPHCDANKDIKGTAFCFVGDEAKSMASNSAYNSTWQALADEASDLRSKTSMDLARGIRIQSSNQVNAFETPNDKEYRITFYTALIKDPAQRSIADSILRHEVGHEFKDNIDYGIYTGPNLSNYKKIIDNAKKLYNKSVGLPYIFGKEVDILYNKISGGHPQDNDGEDFATTIFHDNKNSSEYESLFVQEVNSLPNNLQGKQILQKKHDLSDKIFGK